MNTRFACALVLCSLFGTTTMADDIAPQHLLGKIDFPNSGAPAAQADFIEGVLYMHNFEYAEAGAAFKRAQAVDPNFALAYWGEAMSFHHSLWGRQSTANAREVLERLGKTHDERAARAPTDREKDYVAAAEILFGMTDETRPLPKHDRDVLYRDFMRGMREKYPDDNEALAFYGLSILGAGSENRDYATYMKAAAVLTELWDANRLHPGGAHYLIHAYDDPVHAPLGLPMARAYSKIAPDAAHAQHMTSHIFVAMGMWDDLVAANETAVQKEMESAKETGASMEVAHYIYWLGYGYLQQGRIEKAREMLAEAHAKLDSNTSARDQMYYGALFARYYFDAGSVPAELIPPNDTDLPSPAYHFARAFDAIVHGNADQAELHAKNVNAIENGNPEVTLNPDVVAVLQKELKAMAAYSRSDKDGAITLLQQAAEDSKKLPIRYGPPQETKPSFELLGDVLQMAGKPAEAVAAYERQLESTPQRAGALKGLADAAEAAGNSVKSADARRRLDAIWHAADATVTSAANR